MNDSHIELKCQGIDVTQDDSMMHDGTSGGLEFGMTMWYLRQLMPSSNQ